MAQAHITSPAAAAPGGSRATWRLEVAPSEARDWLHHRPFRVAHNLHQNPLFSMDSLLDLARDMEQKKGNLYFDAGKVEIGDKWGEIPIPQMPLTEIVRRIETAGAWVIMKEVEKYPEFKAVMDEFESFVRDFAGEAKSKYLNKPEMLVIITSPKRLTSFHFDAEPNFLIQVAGSKDAWVCDPADRTITTEEEIERYYAVNNNAGTYKPHAAEKATKFRLEPGEGIHIPTHGAHWVQNGDNVSVSLSLNFEFPDWMYRDVYRANYHLRRLGLNPRRPGEAPVADRAKAISFGAIAQARSSVKGMLASLRGKS